MSQVEMEMGDTCPDCMHEVGSPRHVCITEISDMTIFVNGKKIILENAPRQLSYEAILKMAGFDGDRILSVAYLAPRKGDELREGSLRHGESTALEDGMIFDVANTSSA